MAGVRPQAPAGGRITAVHVWLIVFVVLWLGFAVATVLLAFRQEDLASRTKQAESERDSVLKPTERGQFAALLQAARQGRPATSLVGALWGRYSELAKRVTGAPQDDLETVKTKIRAAMDRMAGTQATTAPTTAAAGGLQVERWQGAVELPTGELGFATVFTVDAGTGAQSGTIDIPAQGVAGAPLTGVSVGATEIRFALGPPSDAAFSTTRPADAPAASGQLQQRGQTFAVRMDRVSQEEAPAAPGTAPAGGVSAGLRLAEDAPLLEVIDQLYGAFVGERERAEQALAQAQDAGKQRDDAIKVREAAREGFDRRVGELDGKVKELEQQGQTFGARAGELEQEYRDARGKTERAYDEDRRQWTERNQTLEADKKRLEELVERQGEIIARFRPKTEQWGLATQADGRVLTALPGDPIVYIDIGRQATNPITLGLTFEVYAGDKPIPEGGKGKATIEVVNIHGETSACKIAQSTPGDPVVEGDYVVNPIYDRERKYRFVVLGTFDLNGDGREEAEAPQKIASLIEQWGGQVVEALDARTDFVVLGGRPGPVGVLSEAATAQEVEQHRQAQARAARYDQVLAEAKALRVTILTQNEFLSFVSRSKGLASTGGP